MKIDNLQKVCLLNSDDIRYPLIVESVDWENDITPALVEWGLLIYSGANLEDCAILLRILAENIYVMGYRRGKSENKV